MGSAGIKTLLAATSLAEESDRVVETAHEISDRTGAELHLFHAYPLPIAFYGTPLGMTAIHPQALEGEKERCEAMMEEQPAQLVVIGTHGRSGFERFLLGSVAADIARRAPTDVLVIPPAIAREPDR